MVDCFSFVVLGTALYRCGIDACRERARRRRRLQAARPKDAETPRRRACCCGCLPLCRCCGSGAPPAAAKPSKGRAQRAESASGLGDVTIPPEEEASEWSKRRGVSGDGDAEGQPGGLNGWLRRTTSGIVGRQVSQAERNANRKLQARFDAAAAHFSEIVQSLRLKTGDGVDELPASTLLSAYGLYKQAKYGDMRATAPWSSQVRARAKYDAWLQRKGLSQGEAMRAYIELVEGLH